MNINIIKDLLRRIEAEQIAQRKEIETLINLSKTILSKLEKTK